LIYPVDFGSPFHFDTLPIARSDAVTSTSQYFILDGELTYETSLCTIHSKMAHL